MRARPRCGTSRATAAPGWACLPVLRVKPHGPTVARCRRFTGKPGTTRTKQMQPEPPLQLNTGTRHRTARCLSETCFYPNATGLLIRHKSVLPDLNRCWAVLVFPQTFYSSIIQLKSSSLHSVQYTLRCKAGAPCSPRLTGLKSLVMGRRNALQPSLRFLVRGTRRNSAQSTSILHLICSFILPSHAAISPLHCPHRVF